MNDTPLPMTDLGLLEQEILSQPPEAALPANLPDRWLRLIARDLELADSVDTDAPSVAAISAAAPLALIYRILDGKGEAGEASIPVEVLLGYFFDFRVEVNSELVSRLTRTRFEPATLQSIFSNRTLALRQAQRLEAEPLESTGMPDGRNKIGTAAR
ncbi:hypothetical protein M0765_023620 [Variovorax sp. S2]|jgi:hypothetical protein|uniref:hypothetical protein n=1 Tax=Variovorax TaxID=34072 RepID=UPI00215BC700|nr:MULTISPECIES: hypothetical protein [Variovorax]MCR8960607.1 hypothetical protein [Variovorax sp. S12S4]WGT63755.1 hypothetical protein QHG62_27670 [Variovorax paradoxus]